MNPSAEDYAEAVANGAALLDERVPGWRERIDVTTLDQSDCSQCALGQLFGQYTAGLRYLGIGESPHSPEEIQRAAVYGFHADHGFNPVPTEEEEQPYWDALKDAWVKEVQR